MVFMFVDCNWEDHVGDVAQAFGVVGQRTPDSLQWNKQQALTKYKQVNWEVWKVYSTWCVDTYRKFQLDLTGWTSDDNENSNKQTKSATTPPGFHPPSTLRIATPTPLD
jgi:hypothetical protein